MQASSKAALMSVMGDEAPCNGVMYDYSTMARSGKYFLLDCFVAE